MERFVNTSLITAIKTPYLSNGKIDLPTFDKLIERQIQYGVQGLVISGTTGEGHLMNWEEQMMLIGHSVTKYSKDLLIIGNTGSNNTREGIQATEYGFAMGMDAALHINPYYGKTSEAGILEHFNQLLACGPAIIYNVPGRTGQDIPPHIIQKIAKHPNFIGIKECMGNERIKLYEEQGISCWSGNDDSAFESRHHYGAHGVISVASNVVPALMLTLMQKNDSTLNNQLMPLFDWLFCQPNPIPLNTLLAMVGLIHPVFRLPYLPLTKDIREKGLEIIKQLQAPEIDLNQTQVLSDAQFIVG